MMSPSFRGDPTYPSSSTAPFDARSAAPQAERAEVRAEGIHTTYTRSGAGPSVLLLVDEGEPGATQLRDALAARMRVLVLELGTCPAGSEPAFAACLTSFLDGLGIPEIPVVAVGIRAQPSLAWALDRGRSTRLALLSTAALDDGWTAPLHDVLERGRLPLFVVGSRDTSATVLDAERAIDALVRFLLADPGGKND